VRERIEPLDDIQEMPLCNNRHAAEAMRRVQWSVPASPQFDGPGWAKDGYSKGNKS
jgi:hypothetical protein